MNRLIWKIRELISSLIPLVIVAGLLWGGFTLYRQGAFKRGIGPAVSSVLYKMPYFGSRFKHYNKGSSYAVANKKYKKAKAKRGHSRRHHRRRR